MKILNCKLIKIYNKDSLAQTLGVTKDTIVQIIKNKQNYYNVFEENGRTIEEPINELKLIHANIFKGLKSLPLPKYVHSGRKAHSYITNACVHAGYSRCVLTTDIHKFYKSTNKKYIARFFIDMLNIPNNLGHLLADLLVYDGYLPTGSPASQLVALFAYRQCFEEINKFCIKAGYTMSLYVDDITISSKSTIDKDAIVLKLTNILSKYKLSLKNEKTLLFTADSTKKVTGVLINSKGKVFAPEKLKRKFLESLYLGENRSVLIGYRTAIRAIEGKHAFRRYDKILAKRI